MQRHPQQSSAVYRQPPPNIPHTSLISRPPASAAALADHRTPSYTHSFGPQRSLPSSPIGAPTGQATFQRFEAQMHAQSSSPMSPNGNSTGLASTQRVSSFASGSSFVPQPPNPLDNLTLQNIQSQYQQLRSQTQPSGQSFMSAPQSYQERPHLTHTRTLQPQNTQSQSAGWSSNQGSVYSQIPAARHTLNGASNVNQPSQPWAQPGELAALQQRRPTQTAPWTPEQLMMMAMAEPANNSPAPTATAAASQPTSRNLGNPVTASSYAQPASSTSASASSPAALSQQQANIRPASTSAGQVQQQQQQQQSLPAPSAPSLTHATKVIAPMGRYLERAYLATQLAVAQEFDSLSSQFNTLRNEKAHLEKLLGERDAEISQLRQKLSESETGGKKLAGERVTLQQQLAQLILIYRNRDQQANLMKSDLVTIREVNKTLAKYLFKLGQMPTDAIPNYLDADDRANADAEDIPLVQLGPFTVPQALGQALQSTVAKSMSDQFEKQFAEMMLTNVADRTKVEKENALLKAHLVAQGIALPSMIAQNPEPARSTIPQITVPVLEPIVSPLTPPAEPSAPPRRSTISASTSLAITNPGDSSQSASAPERPHPEIVTASLPTPTPTASPQLLANSVDQLVKQEDIAGSLPFPWDQREVVDLTGILDSPVLANVSLAPLGLNLGTLEGHLEDPVDTTMTTDQVHVDDVPSTTKTPAEEPAAFTPSTVFIHTAEEGGKKRDSEDADMDDDGSESRKKPRLELLEDVETSNGQHGNAEGTVRDSTPNSPDFLAIAMNVDSEADPTTSSGSPSVQTSSPHLDQATQLVIPPSPQERVDQSPVVDAHTPKMPDTHSPQMDSSEPSPLPRSGSPTLSSEEHPQSTPSLDTDSLSILPTETPSHHMSPPQLGNSTVIEVRVKQEIEDIASATLPPQRPPSRQALNAKTFSLRHLELAYHTNGERRTCRMCIMRKKADASYKVAVFPASASWNELRDHCANVHPEGFRSLVGLSPARVAEMTERIRNKNG